MTATGIVLTQFSNGKQNTHRYIRELNLQHHLLPLADPAVNCHPRLNNHFP